MKIGPGAPQHDATKNSSASQVYLISILAVLIFLVLHYKKYTKKIRDYILTLVLQNKGVKKWTVNFGK